MSRHLRIALATALAVGATMIGALSPGTAQAGGNGSTGSVEVELFVYGGNAEQVISGLTLELWESIPQGTDIWPGFCSEELNPFGPSPEFAAEFHRCTNLSYGEYELGIDGVPDGARVEAGCNPQSDEFLEKIPGTATEMSISSDFPEWGCYVTVYVPTLRVDKIVVGGSASSADFDIEVYDDGGTLVTTLVDTIDAECSLFDNNGNCATTDLPLGNFQLGESAVPGYLPTNVGCALGSGPDERFPDGIGEFELSVVFEQFYPLVYCTITNTYFTGDIVVDKVVVNDDGGTATADDFTAEVFLESDGSSAASEQCAADGLCIDEQLAIGEYRVGESGPSGYTATVECEVTVEPDVPQIGTVPPTLPPQGEALPGDTALFELEPFGEVTCTITNNDDPQPTTTTTTTVAPTTTDQAQAPVLPATGGDSDSLGLIAALGAAMLLMGGTLLAARRRS